MPNKDEQADWNNELGVALGITRQQRVEWNREVDEERQHERHLVIGEETLRVVRHFFRNVRIPDQQELAHPEVTPQHGNREHPLGDVVHVARGYFLVVTFTAQPNQASNSEISSGYLALVW